MKKLKTVVRFVLALGILSCFVFGVAGCETSGQKAAKEINAYAELLLERNEYSDENKAAIETIRTEGTETVKHCKDEAEREQTVNDFMYRMDAVEPIENHGTEITGTFYSLEEAYKNGFITKGDLERIAFYSNYNENLTKYPRSVNANIEQAIKESAAERLRNERSDFECVAEGFTIGGYCGSYNRCYVISVDSIYWAYGTVVGGGWHEIGGVQIYISGPVKTEIWKLN